MTTAAVQTIWADLIASSLADAGVRVCVISPGSRSTPLVAALAREPRLELVTIIDERAAAFYALGAARATNIPAALVCTSGTAAAHYLPAIIEASLADVPLVAITADRPPELQNCGASQTIEQHGLYRAFVRGEYDLGTPSEAVRALRRTMMQAITRARGPHPGPVHINVPLKKPLEPDRTRVMPDLGPALVTAAPRSVADASMIEAVARAIAEEPDGVIVVGAMPAQFAAARDNIFALAVRAGYPLIAEAGSQLRFGSRERAVACVDHFDLVPAAELPSAKLVIQLGAEPVAAGWPAWLAHAKPARIVLAGHHWYDPEGNAQAVILGDVADAVARILEILERTPLPARTTERWAAVEERAAQAAASAIEQHARSETALLRTAIDAMPEGSIVQIGNSLPIRVVDHACAGGVQRTVLTQRGAAGIDGLISSAAGATRAGKPVLLVLGDVSFVHDLGGLVAARAAVAPLAILVVDNRGGQIFAGLPVAKAELGGAFAEHWLTAPNVDPAAVANALGIRSVTASSPSAAASAVSTALAESGVTVIHAPVSMSGAHDVRRTAIELFLAAGQQRRTS
ncbi:MAG: 2-succinyl-5-enolpyruvyl-6-hydroxy-3-cyclohexene-1-carboxylic-acid synthase [Myxococcota bacterium]|nr:2-succinyl-5-enolpyruvyl-6-hydroxy-3-cyclohexene-1-carboxylic-acid synthase [Myxococcota bacterium]